MRPLSVDKLNIVIYRLHSGQTTCQISSSTGFTIGTITKIHSEHFSDLPKSSGNYPVKLSPANVCHVVCCDKTNMINLFSLSIYNKKTKNTRNDPNMTHTSPRQTHTSIGPSNRSEEARPSMMINRCQTGSNMRERAVKVPLHLHRNHGPHRINSQTLSPQERSQTLTQETHNAPRNEQEHIPHTGEFHPSLHSPFIPFISVTCRQGLLCR